MSESIRVLVVDDSALLRMGLTQAIGIEADMTVVGSAATADEALTLYPKLRPDVVTMDYQMTGMNGVECTRRIRATFPEARVVILSVQDVEEYVWSAVQAGALGYLTKEASEVEEVLDAIREIHAGGTYFPAHIAETIRLRETLPTLSPREMEMLRAIAAGQSNKEIAAALQISINTVKLHISNLFDKLDATDRTQAVVIAIRRGMLKPQ